MTQRPQQATRPWRQRMVGCGHPKWSNSRMKAQEQERVYAICYRVCTCELASTGYCWRLRKDKKKRVAAANQKINRPPFAFHTRRVLKSSITTALCAPSSCLSHARFVCVFHVGVSKVAGSRRKPRCYGVAHRLLLTCCPRAWCRTRAAGAAPVLRPA